MEKTSLSKRELLLISILAFSVLVYLYLNYLLFPSYDRITVLRDELQQKQLIAVNKEAALKRLTVLDSILEEEQLHIEALEKEIPYNVRLPELIVNIDGKIREIGMDIKSISIGDVDLANKEYGVIPVSVSMEGKYDGILEFIKYIEDSDRKYIVDSFALSPERREEPISVSISMRTFMLKDSENSIIPEPYDYPFFKHNNGKSYPFMENNTEPEPFDDSNTQNIEEIEAEPEPFDNNNKDIEETEKKYKELYDIINMIKAKLPWSKKNGEGN